MSDVLQGIDAIIFDFGNVLIDLNYPEVIRRFTEVAKKNKERVEELVVTAPVLQEFEMGMIGSDEFRTKINSLLGTNMGELQFEDIWNSMLKSITKERMDKVIKIGERFDTFILSNTNKIHEIAYDEMIMMENGKDTLRDFVKKVYYSHEMGMRKPNLDCYKFVIDDIGCDPSGMLFLDDRLDNIEMARKAGMRAIQIFDPDKQLNEIFDLEVRKPELNSLN